MTKERPPKREISESDEYPPTVARDRFERAVDVAAGTKPIHRAADKASNRKRQGRAS